MRHTNAKSRWHSHFRARSWAGVARHLARHFRFFFSNTRSPTLICSAYYRHKNGFENATLIPKKSVGRFDIAKAEEAARIASLRVSWSILIFLFAMCEAAAVAFEAAWVDGLSVKARHNNASTKEWAGRKWTYCCAQPSDFLAEGHC